jgi:phosphatidylglycerophosphatase A
LTLLTSSGAIPQQLIPFSLPGLSIPGYSPSMLMGRKSVNRFLITFVGSFFYTGFFPFAPATFASLVWLALFLFVPGGRMLVHPAALAVMLPVSVFISGRMERYYGRDASVIVIDEFVGMQTTFIAVEPSLSVGVAGFFLFRLFDVVKPFPIGPSQRLRGGFGVVVDDLLAGIYGRIVLLVLAGMLHSG